MNHLLKRICTLFSVALLCTYMACSDDEGSVPTVAGIDIPEGTVVSGDAPGTSSSAETPEIESSAADLVTVPGGELVIRTNVLSGDVIGFYLQIDGTDVHYKISSTSPPINGRVQSDFPYFVIRFAESFEPREVCIRYAGYDAEDRASNYITRCIQVKEAGGANSEFLTGHAWQAVSIRDYSQEAGTDIETLIGETVTSETEVGINCNGVPTNVTIEVKSRTNYQYLTLTAGGAAAFEESFYYKVLDPENSNCTPAYTEATDVIESDGIWIYESGTSNLYLVLTSDEAGSVAHTYTVAQDGGNIVLKETYNASDFQETLYEPKN